MTAIIRGEIPGVITPYTRVGRERWTPRATRYLASRDWLRRELHVLALRAGLTDEDRAGLWGVDLEVGRYYLRGDLDNIVKAVLDAGNGVIWDDDQAVHDIHARRWPCRKGEDVLVLTAYTIAPSRMERRGVPGAVRMLASMREIIP